MSLKEKVVLLHLLEEPPLVRLNFKLETPGSSQRSECLTFVYYPLTRRSFGHYIQNVGDEPLEFLEIFRGANFGDKVSISHVEKT